jgi:hypothetical protein
VCQVDEGGAQKSVGRTQADAPVRLGAAIGGQGLVIVALLLIQLGQAVEKGDALDRGRHGMLGPALVQGQRLLGLAD